MFSLAFETERNAQFVMRLYTHTEDLAFWRFQSPRVVSPHPLRLLVNTR